MAGGGRGIGRGEAVRVAGSWVGVVFEEHACRVGAPLGGGGEKSRVAARIRRGNVGPTREQEAGGIGVSRSRNHEDRHALIGDGIRIRACFKKD